MKCSFDISNFLEKICLILSVVIFCFFGLFTEEGILVSPCSFLEFAFSWRYLSFSSLIFASLLSSAICQTSLDDHFAFLLFFFFGMVLFAASCTVLRTSVHSSSSTVLTRSGPLNLFVTSTENSHGIWFKSCLVGQGVFPVFFSLSLNFAISRWSEPQSGPGLVFADYIQLLHLQLRRMWSVWFQYWPFGDVHV